MQRGNRTAPLFFRPMTAHKLLREFYLRPTLSVARDLLGKLLVRRVRSTLLVGRIVETEAYRGSTDPASHAFKGQTERNAVMFREGGHLYVYFTYGMHFCANVVTEREGKAGAVLIRALEPIEGIETMARARDLSVSDLRNLCSGPAKMCQALRIRRKENGTDLCGDTIWIAEPATKEKRLRIARTRRIGISEAKEHLWRFTIAGSLFLSR
jgi:DNA-3-methyladenine glycosylase